MLAEFSGGHAGVMAEKMAEIEFTGEAQLARDILDGKPFVRQQ